MKLTKELDLLTRIAQAHNFAINEIVDAYEEEHGEYNYEQPTQEWLEIGQRAYLDLVEAINHLKGSFDVVSQLASLKDGEKHPASVVSDILTKHMNEHIDMTNAVGEGMGGWEVEKTFSLAFRCEIIDEMYLDLMQVIPNTLKEAMNIDTEYEPTFYETKEEMEGDAK